MIDNIINALSGTEFTLWIFSLISVPDVIDMLIVAYAIYKIISWIRQTRAWSLFRGIALIVLVMGISGLFDLNTTYWLLSNTLNVGLIAIIVIFHPELRKALEQLGKGKAFGFFTGQESVGHNLTPETANAILSAARVMSKDRVGAIMVIQREVDLEDIEQTGITVDAAITSQLIEQIFVNKTPLHDGAVLIKNNRVAAACCILPLTAEEIGKELGTRHRAAVGVSEIADADVLVVSEETGRITMAQGGKLYKGLSEQQLLSMLLNGTQTPEDKKKTVLWKGRHNDAGKA